MIKFAGLFVGSGAARYVGLGFRPDFVRIRNVSAADLGWIEWNKFMAASATSPEGVKYADSTKITMTALTKGAGIRVYAGGDTVSAAAATHLVPVNALSLYQGDQRSKGSAGTVTKWTLDTTANATGHFDKLVDTTYVGVGSKVFIRNTVGVEEVATITAISSDGDAADNVTLDRSIGSGEVVAITFKYELYNAEAGMVMPEGIYLAETADVNVNGELCMIEAGTYEK